MNNDVTVIFSIQYCLKLYWNTSVHRSHQTYSKAYRYTNIIYMRLTRKTVYIVLFDYTSLVDMLYDTRIRANSYVRYTLDY